MSSQPSSGWQPPSDKSLARGAAGAVARAAPAAVRPAERRIDPSGIRRNLVPAVRPSKARAFVANDALATAGFRGDIIDYGIH